MLAAGKACAVSQLRSPLHAAVVDTQSSRGSLVVVHGKPPQKNMGLYFDYEPVDPKAQQKQAYEDAERIEEEFSWVSRARSNSKEHRLAGKANKKSKSRKMWEKKQREEAAARSIHRTASASPPPVAMDARTGTASPAVLPLPSDACVRAGASSPPVGDPWADDTATASSPTAPSKQAPQKEAQQSNANAPKSAMRARKQRLMQRMKGEASAPADVGSSNSTLNSRQWVKAAAATPVVVPTVMETEQPTISPRQASTADSVTPKPTAAPLGVDGDFEFDENMDVNAFAQQLIEMLTGRGGDDDMDDDDFDFDLSKLGLDVDDDMDLDLGSLDKLSDDEVKKYLDLLGDDDDDQNDGDFDDIVSKIEEDDSLDDKERMRALYSVQGMLNTPAQPSDKPKKPANSGPARNRSSTTGMAKLSMSAPGESKEDIVVPLKPKPPRPGQ